MSAKWLGALKRIGCRTNIISLKVVLGQESLMTVTLAGGMEILAPLFLACAMNLAARLRSCSMRTKCTTVCRGTFAFAFFYHGVFWGAFAFFAIAVSLKSF